MSTKARKFDNYNEENIRIVRSYYENRLDNNTKDSVFTMEQKNAPSKVTRTKKSLEVCADYLTRL